jgi:hypothetical protein
MNMKEDEQGKKISQVIAKAWADEGFKRKLLKDPAATLEAAGVALPPGRTIKAVENDDKVFHLVIPSKPSELSEDELDRVAGGVMGCTCDTPGRTYTGSIITKLPASKK